MGKLIGFGDFGTYGEDPPPPQDGPDFEIVTGPGPVDPNQVPFQPTHPPAPPTSPGQPVVVSKPAWSTQKKVLIALAVVAVGAVAYVGYQYATGSSSSASGSKSFRSNKRRRRHQRRRPPIRGRRGKL